MSPVAQTPGEREVRDEETGLLVAMLAMILAAAAPAFAAGQGAGGGVTVEEFVCFRSAGDEIRLDTGKAITTLSGNVNVVCTDEPL